jgi:predicted ATPase
MRAYTAEVRRSRGLELRMRVGLNSGEVVVRAIGNDLHMDYSAVGETTVLAARMEQTATPGSIRLPSSTLGLVDGLVQVQALGPVPVKGLEEPIEVFELTGASQLRRRLQATAARGLTPFVGRQHEMEALQQALAQVHARHGQVVALVGAAGVGKSRLVYEVVHSHCVQGWRVLESASVSYGKATLYFPIIDLLRRYCHVDDSDDARTIRARVTGQALTLDEALQDTLPALLVLLDAVPDDSPFLHLDPPQRRQRTLDGLKRLLLRESQEQPLLLVFEDLHWIDAETQALLDTLVESLPTARLLLLVTYRPEYQHGWGSKQQVHRQIAEALETLFPETVETQPELLAHHYTAAALPEPAVAYWQRAGQRASDRSAHPEAVSHFTTGIELLKTLPETPERIQQSLTLHIALGAALLVIKGQAAPEVEHAYT